MPKAPIRSLLLAFALVVGAMAPSAHAQAPSGFGFELKGGVLAHDVPGLWSGFQLEKGIDLNAEILFGRGWSMFGGNLRPALGGSFNLEGYTSKGYADLRWEWELPLRTFIGLGLGAAIHDGRLDPTDADRKALGSRILFHVPLEFGVRLDERQSLSVYFEHTSNGRTARYNEALDNVGVRYGVKF